MHPLTGQCEGVIAKAFSLGGETYYEFVDALSTPHQRALSAIAEASTLEYNISRAYLKAFLELTDKYVLNQVPRDEFTKQLVGIYDRLTWATEPIIVYRVAACLYFDKNESPYSIDETYNNLKIEKWIKAKKTDDFFLLLPLKKSGILLQDAWKNSVRYSIDKLKKALPLMSRLGELVNEREILPWKQELIWASLITRQ